VERPTTGQVQPSDKPRPSPPNSFWDKSYDLPQWFESDTPKVDSSESSSFLGSPTSSASTSQVVIPDGPASPDAPLSSSPATDTVTQVQAIATTFEPPSITLDDILTVQVEDDNLLPVIQALLDQAQPAHADLRQYPEEARVLLAQLDSLVLQDGTLYRKFHYPDVTVNFLQIVLPAKLRCPFIERLHAELGTFWSDKDVSCRAYFTGWRSYTRLLVCNCAVCNLYQRSRQTPRQAALKPMQEFRPMAVLHADLVVPLPEGQNSRNQ